MDMQECKECRLKYKVLGMRDSGVCPLCEDLTKPLIEKTEPVAEVPCSVGFYFAHEERREK